MANESEYKFNSSFNNQLKYTHDSKLPETKIKVILKVLDIKCLSEAKHKSQKDTYFDTSDRAIRKEGNSLRIRETEGKPYEVTSKHFISRGPNGLYQRREGRDPIKPGNKPIEVLLNHAKKHFRGLEIRPKPVVIINNYRFSFKIKTDITTYELCLDKFYFEDTEDKTTSDDFYEIEVEHDSKKKVKPDDPQIEKLSVVFEDIIGFGKSEKNKYEKGVDWVGNKVIQKDMPFILFDVVKYSSKTSRKQKSIIKEFTEIILDVLRECECSEESCLKIPIGDGVILCLNNKGADKALKIVKMVMEKLNENNKKNSKLPFELRTAINYGPVLEYQDINNHLNLAGKGINIVSRMLSKADKNQILISDGFYEFYDETIPEELTNSHNFSKSFSITVKGNKIRVRNFYVKEENIGIPHPGILKRLAMFFLN